MSLNQHLFENKHGFIDFHSREGAFYKKGNYVNINTSIYVFHYIKVIAFSLPLKKHI